MIERLVRALQALAAPPDVQRARFPEFGATADAVALDYGDALLLALDCPQLRFEPEQRVVLERLDERLDRLRGAGSVALWTATALRDSAEWTTVRALAADALRAIGAPRELPPVDADSRRSG